MGNHHSATYSNNKPKKNVHWKTAERPAPPGKPEIIPLYSEDEPNAITLRWLLPVHDGGTPLAGFHVECNRIGTSAWIATSPPLVTRPELILTGLDPGYRYQFRVAASNILGYSDYSEISDILTISGDRSPFTAPKFDREIENYTCLENEKSEFSVEFSALPLPNIAWFKDGYEIFSSRRTAITASDNTSVLVFHQTLLTDEGEIKCTATNRAGYSVCKANLFVEAPPKLRFPRQYEDGLLYGVGETIFLKTTIVGKPIPGIEWKHDGQILTRNDRIDINTTPKYSILRIHSALRSDRGEYQILAKNSIGEDVASFLVTVTAPPDQPTNLHVTRLIDKSVTISWEAPADDGGCKVGNYIIEYYRIGWNVWLKATTSRKLTATLFDLIEGSQYRFRVKAENPYGISEPSIESNTVFIPGKSADLSILEAEFKIIHEVLRKEDGEDIPPISPPRKRNKENCELRDFKRSKSPRILNETLLNEKEYNMNYNIDYISAPDKKEDLQRSNEFMILLYPDRKRQSSCSSENRKAFQLDLEDSLCPPPLSLSAPDLSQNILLEEMPLRNSISSTELLHEKAMDRLYKAVAMKEELEKKFKEFSTVLDKKDKTIDVEIIPSAYKSPNIANIDQQLAKVTDYMNFVEESGELYEDNKPQPTDFYSSGKTSRPWQSISFDEDYTASTASTGEESALEENLSEQEDDETEDEQGEKERIISEVKTFILPDPNFIPKPILKRSYFEPDVRKTLEADVSTKPKHKPTLFQKISNVSNFPKLRLGASKKEKIKNTKPTSTPSAPPPVEKNVIQNSDNKQNEIDEGKVIVEHYGNLVKEFGGKSRKKPAPLLLKTEDLKLAAESQFETKKTEVNLNDRRGSNISASSTVSKTPKINDVTMMEDQGGSRRSSIRGLMSQSSSRQSSVTCNTIMKTENKKAPRAVIVIPVDLDQLQQQAKRNVKSAIDYTVDGCLLILAFWLYFFKDERLAIPLLMLIIYRQLKEIKEVVVQQATTWLGTLWPKHKKT